MIELDTEAANMQRLITERLTLLVTDLSKHKEVVKITPSYNESPEGGRLKLDFHIGVHADDYGRVCGRNGTMIDALRTVARGIAGVHFSPHLFIDEVAG